MGMAIRLQTLRATSSHLLVVAIMTACSGGSTPAASQSAATTSGGSELPQATPGGGASGAVTIAEGTDLCTFLAPGDFTAAGVGNATDVSKNSPDPRSFFCVYAGRSSATGGIEMDASIIDPADADSAWSPPLGSEDVTALVPGADRAAVGTTSDGGPEFALIHILSGNLWLGIGIPATGDWRASLLELARVALARAEDAGGVAAPSMMATMPPTPTSGSSGGTSQGDCPFISDAELASALGVSDLTPLIGPSTSSPEGLVDCGAFRDNGMYIQITLWKGSQKAGFDSLWESGKASPAFEPLPGIGDEAGFGITGDEANGGAIVGSIGITVAIDGPLNDIDVGKAMRALLELVAGRV